MAGWLDAKTRGKGNGPGRKHQTTIRSFHLPGPGDAVRHEPTRTLSRTSLIARR
jgi:hypothetical protein